MSVFIRYPTPSATVTTFTPTVPGNFPSPTPGTVQQALDQLAAITMIFTSNPGPAGLAIAVMVVTGLLATDTILAITQKTPGTVPTSIMVGYSAQITNGVTIQYSADPGGGQVVTVLVRRL